MCKHMHICIFVGMCMICMWYACVSRVCVCLCVVYVYGISWGICFRSSQRIMICDNVV